MIYQQLFVEKKNIFAECDERSVLVVKYLIYNKIYCYEEDLYPVLCDFFWAVDKYD